jgi:hypothetical protein
LSAETIIEEIDLRDLRSIVVSADQLVAIDEATRGLVAKMKQALVVRQETEIRNWLEDIATATKVGRVVRALRLSSQPPKAGVPFPPALAVELIDATVAGMTVDAPSERWITLLEAAAFSPVHGKVLPPAVPTVISEDLLKTVTRLGPLMPQLAALFGVMVDPKARAPRPLQQPRGDKNPKKRAADVNKSADAKAPRGPKPTAAPKPDSSSQADAAPTSVATESPVADAPVAEVPVVETPPVETPTVETPAAETSVSETVPAETPAADSAE